MQPLNFDGRKEMLPCDIRETKRTSHLMRVNSCAKGWPHAACSPGHPAACSGKAVCDAVRLAHLGAICGHSHAETALLSQRAAKPEMHSIWPAIQKKEESVNRHRLYINTKKKDWEGRQAADCGLSVKHPDSTHRF